MPKQRKRFVKLIENKDLCKEVGKFEPESYSF
jgi:hypothetical protein